MPKVSVSISDHRLQEILSLVQSIPFPESPPPPAENEYDVVDVDNIPMEMIDTLKAKQV